MSKPTATNAALGTIGGSLRSRDIFITRANMQVSKYFLTLWSVALMPLGSISYADDLEVYVSGTSSPVPPNVLFLMDLSDSMNKTPAGVDPSSGDPSRLDILKLAVTQLLDDPELPDLNVGLGTFQGYSITGPRFPVSSLDDDANTIDPDIPVGTTVREVLKYLIDDTSAWGNTPTVDNMFEMARYLRGDAEPDTWLDLHGTWNPVDNEYDGEYGYRAPHPGTYTGALVNVDPDIGGDFEADCEDYSIRSPPGDNDCADEEAAGLLMECQIYPDRVCNDTTCDADCGTELVCEGTESFTEPAGCLTDSFGSTWVTGTSGGEPDECCSQSDAGGTECIEYLDYDTSCSEELVEVCDTGRNRVTYRDCDIFWDNNRTYKSPITEQCQRTALVVLTDGDPSVNTVDQGLVYDGVYAEYPYDIREMIAAIDPTKSRDDVLCADQSSYFGAPAGGQPFGNCGPELAKFMLENDQVSTIPGSTVTTHTIGFGLSGPAAAQTWGYLQRVAQAGGGGAYEANDISSLITSFKSIINSVTSDNQSFQGFSAGFDSGRLQTSDRAYLALFSPSTRRAWDGNMKGYYLREGELYDLQDRPATSLTSGEVTFRGIAQSFWSSTSDGNDPLVGGLASALTPSSRNIYTITDPTETSAVHLADGQHNLATSNPALTAEMLGLDPAASAAERDALITWVRSARLGDPLHTRPQVVEYGGTTGSVLFFSTNQGMVHAIDVNAPTSIGDTSGGSELFAFVPRRLLANFAAQQSNSVGTNHIYGLDGDLSIWRQDLDNDGIINNSDKVYLFLGMRRGGNAFYAFDVTNPTQPVLLWQVDESAAQYAALGQSWSSLTGATIDDNGTKREVLIVSGGYDPVQDVEDTTRSVTGDTVGLGVYIIDAHTGSLLTSIGPNSTDFVTAVPGMHFSIPSGVRVSDSNSNGIHDRLYFADMGAQLWRIDIKEGASIAATTTASGYKIADLGTDAANTSTAASNRRFYYVPSVARVSRDGDLVYALAIGSGYRAHPLNGTIADKIFTIFDTNTAVGAPATTPSAITLNDLYDASANLIQVGATETDRDTAISALAAKSGWYIDLAASEKVLARVRIFRNRLFATTFSTSTSSSVCSGGDYTNRLYAMNLLDATAALPSDVNNDGVVEADEFTRFVTVADQASILDEPKIVTFHNDGTGGTAITDDDVTPSTCNAVYAGSQQMMAMCSAPIKVNWSKLR